MFPKISALFMGSSSKASYPINSAQKPATLACEPALLAVALRLPAAVPEKER
jgi:hypothetical protein